MDDLKKALTFVLTIVGLIIFYSVIVVKIDIMAHETNARIQKLSADISWHGFLYQRAVNTILEEKKTDK